IPSPTMSSSSSLTTPSIPQFKSLFKAPGSGHMKLISCLHSDRPTIWSNHWTPCSSSPSTCLCDEFFNSFFLFQHHVFTDKKTGGKVARVILTAQDDAVRLINLKITTDDLRVHLEMTHEDGRSCTIVVEPRHIDELCFCWSPALSFDLSAFKREHKFANFVEKYYMITFP
ncbi:hypothetical protein PFISCL1PPCAC_22383, partial [Pristionchus fissidentatus]